MKKFLMAAACLAAAAICSSPAFAQSAGSFSGAFSNGYLIPTVVCATADTSVATNGSITCNNNTSDGALLSANVELPNGASGKMVLLMASLEDAISTDTSVKGGSGKQTATGSGSVVVTPTLYQNGSKVTCPSPSGSGTYGCIMPSQVTFYKQTQSLTANLGDVCQMSGTVAVCTTPESIDLLLSITTANSFNFLVDNSSLPGGTYQLRLGVGVTTSATATSVSAGATVMLDVGAGSLGALVVQPQTPFDTISLCDTNGSCPAQ